MGSFGKSFPKVLGHFVRIRFAEACKREVIILVWFVSAHFVKATVAKPSFYDALALK